MGRPRGRISPNLVGYVFNLFFTALFIYGAWFSWDLYKGYAAGYEAGLQAGRLLRQEAVSRNLMSESWRDRKEQFVTSAMPRRNVTWKDAVYREGWRSAIDKATEDIH